MTTTPTPTDPDQQQPDVVPSDDPAPIETPEMPEQSGHLDAQPAPDAV